MGIISIMKWNWQQDGWPEFSYDSEALVSSEEEFLGNTGLVVGVCKHLDEDGLNTVRVEILSEEALRTSEIEGEHLNRESIQSSIRRHFGLQADRSRVRPAEHGVAEMMTDLYETWSEPLSHDTLQRWHARLCEGRRDIEHIGGYRAHEDPMRVVSGPVHAPKVHFEAPPSAAMPVEMDRFVDWFNTPSRPGSLSTPALAHAGIAHLYFVCIHPFEDGNGRVGRAIAEKSLAQAVAHPTLIALARTINERRQDYYDALARNNRGLEITDWLVYFARAVLDAQQWTLRLIEFVIAKGKFLVRHELYLNDRQRKVLLRMFEEGPGGFKGGLSAANYLSITKTSPATATRDLQDLVARGALTRTGQRKSTRYYLNLV